jgi:hypothetical protein
MIKYILLALSLSSIGFANAHDELKAKFAAIEKSILEAEGMIQTNSTIVNNISEEITKSCSLGMLNFRSGHLSQSQASCVTGKHKGYLTNVATLEKMTKDNEAKAAAATTEFEALIARSKKDLTPEQLSEILSTSSIANRVQFRSAMSSLKTQTLKADLLRQKKEFEDTMEYAFTSGAIANTLNSPLLCQSVSRCNSDPSSRGNISHSAIKKSILNPAAVSAIKSTSPAQGANK